MGMVNSVIVPPRVILAILFAVDSTNQRFPSGPAVMAPGPLLLVGMKNSFRLPMTLRRPILLELNSVNHKCPSPPVVIPAG